MKNQIYTFLLLILCASFAQAKGKWKIYNSVLDTSYVKHQGSLNYKLAIPIGAVAIGTGFALDHTIHVNDSDHYQKEKAIAYLGDIKLLGPAAVTMALTGWAIKDEKLALTGQKSMEAMVGAAAVSALLKNSFNRARPYTQEGPNSYYFFNRKGQDYRSFPSGHATLAFAFFTPLAENYSRWIYLVPAAVAVQRAVVKQHWPSDVIVGSIIGWGMGYFIAHKKTRRLGFSENGLCIYL